ncbi:MAG: RelA/SpoT domain-containing protein [Chloroflexi bacterium]|nr:RelA/SpoT domain-containing protein [Chloroflexota bacterium]
MTRFVEQFDPKEIDAAGRVLANVQEVGEEDSEWFEAFRLVSDWRAVHAAPLKTFRNRLGRRVGRRGTVAQRLKRMPTIISKLERLPRLKLSKVQDIGGCRAIVPTTNDAFRHATELLDSRVRHRLVRYRDYIERPRSSGYRSLHLIYSYNSEKSAIWNGLNTEIQIRSRLQHQWATAVEVVGFFTENDLKSSSGDAKWLRFFALMSSAISRLEDMPIVPDTPGNESDLVHEVSALATELEVTKQLNAFRAITGGIRHFQGFGNPWIVLELDLDARNVMMRPFRPNEEDAATAWYAEKELESRGIRNKHVVLVSARSVNELRRAYPNFFADLSEFRKLVEETID